VTDAQVAEGQRVRDAVRQHLAGLLGRDGLLLLPTMPDVAVRLRAVMSDPNYDLGRVARIIQADAGVSAYLVRMSNSPLMRWNPPVKDVPGAVRRLGMQVTRNLVTTQALRAMFKVKTPVLVDVMQEIWKRSARLAAVSAVLAKRCGVFTSDRALLAGLMQDIGALPILNALDRRRPHRDQRQDVWTIVEALTASIGAMLLGRWGMDSEFVTVAWSRGDWFRDGGAQAELADVVLIARSHVLTQMPHGEKCPRLDSMPAFRKLQLGPLAADDSLTLLTEAESDVREVEEMLGV
jgi:HD-like signal output (HDOD) protein